MSAIIIIAIIFFYFFKPKEIFPTNHTIDYEQVAGFLKRHNEHTNAHLIFLKDKSVFWAQDGNALITYKKIMNKLVVLGDPIGKKEYIKDALLEFEQFAHRYGCKPVFYQISCKYLSLYKFEKYQLVKLGEEAVVDLVGYSLEGKKGAKLRSSRNKFQRQGYSFTVTAPPFSNDFLAELQSVSNSWLGDRKEKGFSVGFYSNKYVSQFPVATIRDEDERVIAFATLASTKDEKKHGIIIDLMRYYPTCPNGTMDVLFTSIFYWGQEQGYQSCSLGMSPLANVGNTKDAKTIEKISKLVFKSNKFSYRFKGLMEFKAKFAHTWNGKYLAYKKTFLPIVIIQLVLLIRTKKIEKESRYASNRIRRRIVG
ncbi:phosphatidylglycerol lysyltransferase domain-containing protein [Cytobacillus sp. Hm23]